MYFITSSALKFKEVATFVPDLQQLEIDLPEIQDMDPHAVIRAKAEAALVHGYDEFIIEDTSLTFNSLNGLPGTFIKWFLKSLGNDGLYDLCSHYSDRSARAKTIIGLYSHGAMHFFEGAVEGTIVKPRGESNFGWEQIFEPAGFDKTYAEMSFEQKNSMSMRTLACQKLAHHLEKK